MNEAEERIYQIIANPIKRDALKEDLKTTGWQDVDWLYRYFKRLSNLCWQEIKRRREK